MLGTPTTPLRDQAREARRTARSLSRLASRRRDQALAAMAEGIRSARERILEANARDLEAGDRAGLPAALRDRLRLDPKRLEGMARGLEQVASLPDPLGREEGWVLPNGLRVRRVRVTLGVIAVIYEARPNVTVEAAGLCFKSENACLLRGSRSAAGSNRVLVEVLQESLRRCGLPEMAIQGVEDLRREAVDELSRLRGLVDCIIPRGGAELIRRVIAGATVPVIPPWPRPGASSRKWTPAPSPSTPPPASPTAESSASAPRSASPPRSSTPGGPWACPN